jgi:hypothetical protein
METLLVIIFTKGKSFNKSGLPGSLASKLRIVRITGLETQHCQQFCQGNSAFSASLEWKLSIVIIIG